MVRESWCFCCSRKTRRNQGPHQVPLLTPLQNRCHCFLFCPGHPQSPCSFHCNLSLDVGALVCAVGRQPLISAARAFVLIRGPINSQQVERIVSEVLTPYRDHLKPLTQQRTAVSFASSGGHGGPASIRRFWCRNHCGPHRPSADRIDPENTAGLILSLSQ